MAKFTVDITTNNYSGEVYDEYHAGSRKAVANIISKHMEAWGKDATSYVFTVARVAKSTGGDQSGGGSEQEG